MANANFAVGDVVRLKSGGYPMTVQGFAPPAPIPGAAGFAADRLVTCVWMNEAGAVVEHPFWPHLLDFAGGQVVPAGLAPAPAPSSFPVATATEQQKAAVIADQARRNAEDKARADAETAHANT